MREHTLIVLVAGLAAISASGISLSVGLAVSRLAARRKLTGLVDRLGVPGGDERKPSSLEAVVVRLCGFADQVVTEAGPASDDLARFRQVLDALPQGVVVCGADTEVKFRNSRAKSLLDNQSDVLAARAVDDALAESAHANPVERTVELYGPPRRTLTVRAVPIAEGSRSLGVIAVLDDVSELRRLESVRRDFVANVSHELKTPVGALGLLAETLAEEDDPVVARHLADRIQTESFRLSRIVNDLLDLSRIEADGASCHELTEVSQVMTEAADGVRAIAQAREIGLVVDEPDPGLVVLADRRQLLSALHNLLDNAIKYTESGTLVSLSASTDGQWVDLVVTDHGLGIPARDLGRVFERFYRVDHGRGRETGGTGLGLAIVRHVAHNHGGRVGVESREGEGSKFTLQLPLVQVPTGTDTPKAGSEPAATQPAEPAARAKAPASAAIRAGAGPNSPVSVGEP